ncbi:MAG: ABC transporter substrate-binding protein [Gammaproteobacteria bacterium]|nr:MAG: ABC transporter substrate-binding protein [Gammaproteobacteria bacterium]
MESLLAMHFQALQRITAVAVATLPLLGGCDAGPGATQSPGPQGAQSVLRRGNGGDPQTLDPALAEDVHAFNVLTDLYEGLVAETADGSLVPGVAARWEIAADGRRYTFHLRDDARWSNGEPVTAGDFVAAWRRVVAPDSASAYAFLLAPLRNFAAVRSGELPLEDFGAHAVGARTLVVELSAPTTYLPGILAMPVAFPVFAGTRGDAGQFRDPSLFVGNGPYRLQEWSPGYRIRLAKNPHFRAAAAVRIDAIEYLPLENPQDELNRYRSGELDLTATVPPAQIAALRASHPDELRIAPRLALYYFAFDLSEPPFDNSALRQALSMSLDREALVNLLGRGEQPAYGIVPPGVAGHAGARYAWRSLAADERIREAQRLYREAGYGDARPLRFTLTYDVGDIHETVALVAAGMWRDALGIEVTLDKKEWKYFLDIRQDRAAWQMMRFAWFGDYNDASTFTDIFRASSPQNLPGYHDPGYDSLLREAQDAIDPAARASLLQRAEQRLLDAYPVLPVYFPVSKHLVSPAVAGFEANILDRHPSRYLRLD